MNKTMEAGDMTSKGRTLFGGKPTNILLQVIRLVMNPVSSSLKLYKSLDLFMEHIPIIPSISRVYTRKTQFWIEFSCLHLGISMLV